MSNSKKIKVTDTPAMLVGSAAKMLYKNIKNEFKQSSKIQKQAKKLHKKATKKSQELASKAGESAGQAGAMFGAGVLTDLSVMTSDVNNMLHKLNILKSKGFDKYVQKLERKGASFARKVHSDVLKDVKKDPLSAAALAAGSPYVTVSNAAMKSYQKAEQAYKKLASTNKAAAAQINKANSKLNKM